MTTNWNQMKTCPRCKESKPIAQFGRRTAAKDGRHPYCGVCSRSLKRKYPQAVKQCTHCGETKPVEEFALNNTNTTDGRQSWCKPCTLGAEKKWREDNPEENQKNVARRFGNYYMSINGRSAHLLNNARSRARRAGVDCSLTKEWIMEKLEKGTCEITGLPFEYKTGHGKGHRQNSFSPSLERIVPIGPYSPENTIMAVWIYNRAKGAFPLEDFNKMCVSVANQLSEATTPSQQLMANLIASGLPIDEEHASLELVYSREQQEDD